MTIFTVIQAILLFLGIAIFVQSFYLEKELKFIRELLEREEADTEE